MDRFSAEDELEDLGAISVETQGIGGVSLDTDHHRSLGMSGISDD